MPGRSRGKWAHNKRMPADVPPFPLAAVGGNSHGQALRLNAGAWHAGNARAVIARQLLFGGVASSALLLLSDDPAKAAGESRTGKLPRCRIAHDWLPLQMNTLPLLLRRLLPVSDGAGRFDQRTDAATLSIGHRLRPFTPLVTVAGPRYNKAMHADPPLLPLGSGAAFDGRFYYI